MAWSIAQVARMSKASSRMLRHYDEIGLLPPARVGGNGYRYYEEEQLLRLQQILLLRELGLGLEAIGEVLYNRGLTAALMTVEAVKRAQLKYGKKPLNGSEVRWGLENLAIDESSIAQLGFTGFMTPIHTSCNDHEGGSSSQIETWDGSRWVVQPGVYRPDQELIGRMVRASAEKYASEKKLQMQDCGKSSP